MFSAILAVIVGLAGLLLGAEGLVRGAASLALRMGVSMLVVGLTIVAFGTSSPELVVSVQAALSDRADVAVGNVIGSNIFNVAVILGIGAVICPVACHASVIRREVPIMIGITLVLPALVLVEHLLNPADAYILPRWAGWLMVASALLYTYLTYKLSSADDADLELQQELAVPVVGVGQAERARLRPVWADLAFIVGGLVLLYFGGQFLLDGAVRLAELAGLSELVIGLTVVAFGTSMPELATSVVAALRNQPDISVGNVIGSNVMNILAVLGIAASIAPVELSPELMWRDLPVALGLSLLCLPLMATRRRIDRWEGVLLLTIFAAYTAMLLIA